MRRNRLREMGKGWKRQMRGGGITSSTGRLLPACCPPAYTHRVPTCVLMATLRCLPNSTLQGPANIEAICLLVELGANVDALLAQRSLETPLHIAARSGRADIIERLVKCPQISATCRTKDGSTSLHYGAAFGQTHVLAPLVAAGCPVDSRDNALNTPLHLAAGERQHHSACTHMTCRACSRAGWLRALSRTPPNSHAASCLFAEPATVPAAPLRLPLRICLLQAAAFWTPLLRWWSWVLTSTAET
jgi:hypothetical protein